MKSKKEIGDFIILAFLVFGIPRRTTKLINFNAFGLELLMALGNLCKKCIIMSIRWKMEIFDHSQKSAEIFPKILLPDAMCL